jgi:hypothetical protein
MLVIGAQAPENDQIEEVYPDKSLDQSTVEIGEGEEFERLKQSEEKVFRAHVLKREIEEELKRINECSVDIDYFTAKERDLEEMLEKEIQDERDLG